MSAAREPTSALPTAVTRSASCAPTYTYTRRYVDIHRSLYVSGPALSLCHFVPIPSPLALSLSPSLSALPLSLCVSTFLSSVVDTGLVFFFLFF